VKNMLVGWGLCIMAIAALDCEPVDYYPHHDEPEQAADLQKGGAGGYGGNNSNFPVGTPSAMGDDNGMVPTQAAPPPPSSSPTFTTNGQGAFSQTRSYSGADTGGSTSGDQSIESGTTTTGTAAGH
jgi:hypothetical protein